MVLKDPCPRRLKPGSHWGRRVAFLKTGQVFFVGTTPSPIWAKHILGTMLLQVYADRWINHSDVYIIYRPYIYIWEIYGYTYNIYIYIYQTWSNYMKFINQQRWNWGTTFWECEGPGIPDFKVKWAVALQSTSILTGWWFQPLCQLGLLFPIWTNKIHIPSHQPVEIWTKRLP